MKEMKMKDKNAVIKEKMKLVQKERVKLDIYKDSYYHQLKASVE